MPGRLDLDQAAAIGLKEAKIAIGLVADRQACRAATMTAARQPRRETNALSPEYKAISGIG
jgi:hypothetical protein